MKKSGISDRRLFRDAVSFEKRDLNRLEKRG
jgi:hypothetical protein